MSFCATSGRVVRASSKVRGFKKKDSQNKTFVEQVAKLLEQKSNIPTWVSPKSVVAKGNTTSVGDV